MNRLLRPNVCSRQARHYSRALRITTIVVVMAFGQLLFSPSGWAKEESRDTANEAGMGVASVLLSIPYGVVKVAYAIAGGVTGGLAYVFTGGNLKAAQSVWDTTMRGTYIITPEHLRGEKPIRFLGVPPEAEGGSTGVSSQEAPPPPSSSSPMIPSEQAPPLQSGPASPN